MVGVEFSSGSLEKIQQIVFLILDDHMSNNAAETPTVCVVDDDEGVSGAIRMLLESVGLKVAAFSNAQEFLDKYDAKRHACALLDVRMPGMSGLSLQNELKARGHSVPIVFITGHGDVRMAVQAVQAGAIDFIEKPFRDQHLLDSIYKALAQGTTLKSADDERAVIAARINSLTSRELEVMNLIVEAKKSKEIARILNISLKTVEFHRSRVMEKMLTSSALDLIRLVLMAQRKDA